MLSARQPVSRQVVVSLHDVAPPFEAAIRTQIGLLASVGVRRLALKVTPDWHGASALHDAPSLVELLRAQVAAGSQLIMHGYTHQARAGSALQGPWLTRTRGRLFAVDAAECLTLSSEEAEEALRCGLAEFERAGLPRPTMFCAPGWLHNAATEAALRRTGFRYMIDMFLVRDLWTQRRIWTPAVGYMGAAPGQEMGVRALNVMIQRAALPSASVAKVYLHPQHDPAGPIVRHWLVALQRMIERDGWQPATYAEVCSDGDGRAWRAGRPRRA